MSNDCKHEFEYVYRNTVSLVAVAS